MASSQRQAQEAVRGRGDSKCPYHPGQNVVYKCHDCNKLACINCVPEMHRKHELDVISDIIPETKRKIQDYVTSTEQKEIPKIKAAMKKGEDDRSLNQQYYKTLTSEIEKQREILKFKLDEAANGLSKACRDMEQRSEDVFHKHETDLQAMIEELNVQIKDCKDALHSENDVLVCDISTFILSEYKAIPTISSYRLCSTTSQLDEQKEKWTKALETLKTLGFEFMENRERHLTLDHQSKDLGSKWFESSEEKLYRLRLDYTILDTENRRLAAEYEHKFEDVNCTARKHSEEMVKLKQDNEKMNKLYISRLTIHEKEIQRLKSGYNTLVHQYNAKLRIIDEMEKENDHLAELLHHNQNQFLLQAEKYQTKIDEQKGKLNAAEEEKEKLLTRLSKIDGAKLTQGNAGITDLSDQNRPMKVAEKYSELYDNEWTDAMEELLDHGDGKSDSEGIAILLEIVVEAYRFCCKTAEDCSKSILLSVACQKTSDSQQVQLTDEHKQMLEEIRKTLSPQLIQCVDQKYLLVLRDILLKYFGEKKKVPVRREDDNDGTKIEENIKHEPEYKAEYITTNTKTRTAKNLSWSRPDESGVGRHADLQEQDSLDTSHTEPETEDVMELNATFEKIIDFGKKCANLSWMMRVHDPPLHMEYDVQLGSELNTDFFKHYTQSGKIVKYLVWPALFLHKNGALLAKGVVQPMKKKEEMKYKSEQQQKS